MSTLSQPLSANGSEKSSSQQSTPNENNTDKINIQSLRNKKLSLANNKLLLDAIGDKDVDSVNITNDIDPENGNNTFIHTSSANKYIVTETTNTDDTNNNTLHPKSKSKSADKRHSTSTVAPLDSPNDFDVLFKPSPKSKTPVSVGTNASDKGIHFTSDVAPIDDPEDFDVMFIPKTKRGGIDLDEADVDFRPKLKTGGGDLDEQDVEFKPRLKAPMAVLTNSHMRKAYPKSGIPEDNT